MEEFVTLSVDSEKRYQQLSVLAKEITELERVVHIPERLWKIFTSVEKPDGFKTDPGDDMRVYIPCYLCCKYIDFGELLLKDVWFPHMIESGDSNV
ncbi:MAG: hypothetical protein OXR68_06005, partial [Alphaproteobacteria bacterium]|nr:hypothetical protein [Alphaproteobacteria bacterium]